MTEAEPESPAQNPVEEDEPTVASHQEAIKSDPNNPKLHYELGVMLKEEGLLEEATEHFSRTAEIEMEASNLAEAVAAYGHVVGMEDVDPTHRLLLAECHEKLEQSDLAVEQYKEAAVSFLQKEEFGPSLDTIRLVLKHDPENLRDSVRIAEALAALDRKEEAFEILEKVVGALKNSQDPKTLTPLTARLIAMKGDDIELSNDLATQFLASGEAALAVCCLNKSYEQNPKNTRTLGLLAEAFNQLGQTHKTVAVLKRKAVIYEEQGLEEERNQAFRDILVMNPEESQIKARLSDPGARPSEESREFEINELPDEEIDALLAEINDAEDEQELGFGSFSINEEGAPVLPPELGGRSSISGARASRIGTEELKRVNENSVITAVAMQSLTGSDDSKASTAAASKAEIMALVERFEMQIGSEDEAAEQSEETGFETQVLTTPEPAIQQETPPQVSVDLSSELEELDFYIESELEDEAKELLEDLAVRYPGHPDLEARKLKSSDA
jgi:tetratricopeptide (TPR) repeat protein